MWHPLDDARAPLQVWVEPLGAHCQLPPQELWQPLLGVQHHLGLHGLALEGRVVLHKLDVSHREAHLNLKIHNYFGIFLNYMFCSITWPVSVNFHFSCVKTINFMVKT